jgi:hypothetical protein
MTSVPPSKMLFQHFFWRYNVYIREPTATPETVEK